MALRFPCANCGAPLDVPDESTPETGGSPDPILVCPACGASTPMRDASLGTPPEEPRLYDEDFDDRPTQRVQPEEIEAPAVPPPPGLPDFSPDEQVTLRFKRPAVSEGAAERAEVAIIDSSGPPGEPAARTPDSRSLSGSLPAPDEAEVDAGWGNEPEDVTATPLATSLMLEEVPPSSASTDEASPAEPESSTPGVPRPSAPRVQLSVPRLSRGNEPQPVATSADVPSGQSGSGPTAAGLLPSAPARPGETATATPMPVGAGESEGEAPELSVAAAHADVTVEARSALVLEAKPDLEAGSALSPEAAKPDLEAGSALAPEAAKPDLEARSALAPEAAKPEVEPKPQDGAGESKGEAPEISVSGVPQAPPDVTLANPSELPQLSTEPSDQRDRPTLEGVGGSLLPVGEAQPAPSAPSTAPGAGFIEDLSREVPTVNLTLPRARARGAPSEASAAEAKSEPPEDASPSSDSFRNVVRRRGSGKWVVLGLAVVAGIVWLGIKTEARVDERRARLTAPPASPPPVSTIPHRPWVPRASRPRASATTLSPASPSDDASSARSAFDPAKAQKALAGPARRAAGCRMRGEPSTSVEVDVTFEPSGNAKSVRIKSADIARTETERCIQRRLLEAKVTPFSGKRSTVTREIMVY